MILPSTELPFGELLAALDQQIDLLEAKRSQLADLFDGLIARDEEAVEAVLERIERTERLQTAADSYLSRVRGELARVIGGEGRKLRLLDVIEQLPPEQSRALADRRGRIVELSDSLRRQHLQTVLVLGECARINRLLLESILPEGESVMTYGTGGSDLWRSGTGLVDTKL